MHVELAAEPDDGWLALYRYRGQPPPPVSRRLLRSARWQAFASVREAGEVLAIGRLAAAGSSLTPADGSRNQRRGA